MLTIITIVVFIEAMSRTFFSHSFIGVDEFATYFMVWIIFFAAVLAAEENSLVSVDAVHYITPEWLKPYFQILASLVSSIFLFIFSAFAWGVISRVRGLGTKSVGIPFFKMWYLYIPACVGSFLMAVEYLKLLILTIHKTFCEFQSPEVK